MSAASQTEVLLLMCGRLLMQLRREIQEAAALVSMSLHYRV